jgi:hypothetical protein
MVVLGSLLLMIVLIVAAVAAKRRGASGGALALSIAAGLIGIVVAMFGILLWGFSGFG